MSGRFVAAFVVLVILVLGIVLTYVAVGVSGAITSVNRVSRAALAYTDFESVPSGWIANGGSWSGTTGFKGNGLQGTDNDGGLGGSSQYLYPTSLSSYKSLWVSVKTKLTVWNSYGTWYGLVLMSSGKSSMYVIEIYAGSAFDSGGTVWYATFNVESANGWRTVSKTSISGYNSNSWYTIVVFYNYTGSSISFRIWIYDASGNQVAYAETGSTSGALFAPAYIGLFVDGAGAVFDDFIISTSDPRYVTFVNIPAPSYKIGIYDSAGSLVNSTVLSSSTAVLGVVNDTVVGTGSGGRIVTWDPNGNVVINYTISSSDAILGGDVYNLGAVMTTTTTTTSTVTSTATTTVTNTTTTTVTTTVPTTVTTTITNTSTVTTTVPVTTTITTTVTNTSTVTETQTTTVTTTTTTPTTTTMIATATSTATVITTTTIQTTITSTVTSAYVVVRYRTATTTVTVSSAASAEWDRFVLVAMIIVLGVSLAFVLYRRR